MTSIAVNFDHSKYRVTETAWGIWFEELVDPPQALRAAATEARQSVKQAPSKEVEVDEESPASASNWCQQ